MAEIPRLRMVIPLWGRSYVDIFLNITLQSLLWPGNLKALGNQSSSSITFYTTMEDAEILRSSPLFRTLTSYVSVYFEDVTKVSDKESYEKLTAALNHFIRKFENTDDPLVCLSPDGVYSDGLIQKILDALASGKRLMLVPGPRCDMTTVVPAMFSEYGNGATLNPISPRQLVKIAQNRLHPETLGHFWHGPEIMTHGFCNLLWKVDDEGWLMHALAVHPLMIRPWPRYRYLPIPYHWDWCFPQTLYFHPSEIYRAEDSDDLFLIGLDEPSRFRPETEHRSMNVDEVSEWIGTWCDFFQKRLLSHTFQFHHGEKSKRWEEVGKEADDIVGLINEKLGEPQGGPAQNYCTLSVIVTNNNQADLIRRCLDSITSQSHLPVKIIALDCGSEDGSIEAMKQYAAFNPLIQVESLDKHETVEDGIARLIKIIDSDYFVVCSSRCEMLPNAFDKMMRLLAWYPTAGMCISECHPYRIDQEMLSSNSYSEKRDKSGNKLYILPKDLRKRLNGTLPDDTDGFIVKTEYYQNIQREFEKVGNSSFWFILTAMAAQSGVVLVTEPNVVKKFSVPTALEQRDIYSGVKKALQIINSKHWSLARPYWAISGLLSKADPDLLMTMFMNKENLWGPEIAQISCDDSLSLEVSDPDNYLKEAMKLDQIISRGEATPSCIGAITLTLRCLSKMTTSERMYGNPLVWLAMGRLCFHTSQYDTATTCLNIAGDLAKDIPGVIEIVSKTLGSIAEVHRN